MIPIILSMAIIFFINIQIGLGNEVPDSCESAGSADTCETFQIDFGLCCFWNGEGCLNVECTSTTEEATTKTPTTNEPEKDKKKLKGKKDCEKNILRN